MEVVEALFPWVCTGIAVVSAVVLPLLASDRLRLRDLQLTLNSTPRTNVAVGLLLTICGIGALLLGAGLLAAGYSYGWGVLSPRGVPVVRGGVPHLGGAPTVSVSG